MFDRTLRSAFLLPAALLLAAAPVIHAEEGMWTFDNPPFETAQGQIWLYTPRRPGSTICGFPASA